ncbi:DUF2218 domain-containing protein [Tistrella sp. BH-R2-4]|jgi:hypothetical protein|uniref:DUF2218 domain-containing protein n=1 Tax=Tistrella arctica TaxID=3133430 RepID=A0ABU9YJL1_9PROT
MTTIYDASVTTPLGRRYMTQLAKHWSHRFAVTHDEETALIPFSDTSRCRMQATADQLSVMVEADDAEAAERLTGVVVEHLNRFAFKEPLVISWSLRA